ncbi:MAG: F0F1 ATP synthase subunit gamma [Anaerolineae bacterium]|nr:F0F1 ATP synthase subunit gamma [Anaerolineae bacterium]
MADIGEIRNRIENLHTIEHLIRSMRAMSAIRWRKAKNQLYAAQRYAQRVQRQLSLVAGYPTPLVRGARIREDAPPHTALIVIGSDHGLCGTFNMVLFNTADVYIRRWRSEGRTVDLIALGEYARRYYCEKAEMCTLMWAHRFPLTHVVSFLETREIWESIEALYQQSNISELYLIYNYFISFGSYRQRLVRLLPPELTPLNIADEDLPILGSDAADLQRLLLVEHLALQLYLGLVESMVSEQGARLQAMDAAMSNIDDRNAELKRTYNTARQEKITQEMLELASGGSSA